MAKVFGGRCSSDGSRSRRYSGDPAEIVNKDNVVIRRSPANILIFKKLAFFIEDFCF